MANPVNYPDKELQRPMELRDSAESPGSFSPEMKKRLMEDFVVGYYNGSVKPNLAEKDPSTGRNVEFLMDSRQFEKTNRASVWSSSEAVGTGYRFRVVYKDKRFSDLDQLLGMYSGSIVVPDEDMAAVEQRLYERIMLLIKEGRLPRGFKLQPSADSRIEKLNLMVESLSQTIDRLERRVRSLESGRGDETQAPEV